MDCQLSIESGSKFEIQIDKEKWEDCLEKAAESLREEWNLGSGPISNVIESTIVGSLGVIPME